MMRAGAGGPRNPWRAVSLADRDHTARTSATGGADALPHSPAGGSDAKRAAAQGHGRRRRGGTQPSRSGTTRVAGCDHVLMRWELGAKYAPPHGSDGEWFGTELAELRDHVAGPITIRVVFRRDGDSRLHTVAGEVADAP